MKIIAVDNYARESVWRIVSSPRTFRAKKKARSCLKLSVHPVNGTNSSPMTVSSRNGGTDMKTERSQSRHSGS
jgi:hypothetical protein